MLSPTRAMSINPQSSFNPDEHSEYSLCGIQTRRPSQPLDHQLSDNRPSKEVSIPTAEHAPEAQMDERKGQDPRDRKLTEDLPLNEPEKVPRARLSDSECEVNAAVNIPSQRSSSLGILEEILRLCEEMPATRMKPEKRVITTFPDNHHHHDNNQSAAAAVPEHIRCDAGIYRNVPAEFVGNASNAHTNAYGTQHIFGLPESQTLNPTFYNNRFDYGQGRMDLYRMEGDEQHGSFPDGYGHDNFIRDHSQYDRATEIDAFVEDSNYHFDQAQDYHVNTWQDDVFEEDPHAEFGGYPFAAEDQQQLVDFEREPDIEGFREVYVGELPAVYGALSRPELPIVNDANNPWLTNFWRPRRWT